MIREDERSVVKKLPRVKENIMSPHQIISLLIEKFQFILI